MIGQIININHSLGAKPKQKVSSNTALQFQSQQRGSMSNSNFLHIIVHQVTAAICSLPVFLNLATGWRITRFELLKYSTRISAGYNAIWNLTVSVITSIS